MKHKSLVVLLSLVAATLCFQAQPRPAYSQNKPPEMIMRLLDQSGYSFTKAADGVWTITFQGRVLPEFNLVITSQQDIVVLFVVVAAKKDLNATPEVMAKLLKLNEQLDRVKIGIDSEGDTFVRTDLSARVLDTQEMKTNIEQVSAAADEVYGVIKPYINTSK